MYQIFLEFFLKQIRFYQENYFAPAAPLAGAAGAAPAAPAAPAAGAAPAAQVKGDDYINYK